MLFLACFKVGRYLVPKINLFYALKYKYLIKHGPTNNPTLWDHDCRFVPQVRELIQRLWGCDRSSIGGRGRGRPPDDHYEGDREDRFHRLRRRLRRREETEGVL